MAAGKEKDLATQQDLSMCGICGKIGKGRVGELDKSVRAMKAMMMHRGPDGEGELIKKPLGMGMRRLSIIDVGGGNQPLFNEDRKISIVANGEIYNYLELRSALKRKGHIFRTGSDCETVIHLYEDYGLRFVDKLVGMFAIALWDDNLKRLVLIRDRMGEKPLYYTFTDDGLVFASEMKVLLRSGGIRGELDKPSLDTYFHYYYIPEPRTAFSNIHKLPAGCLLTYEPLNGQHRITRYWSAMDTALLEGDPVEQIRSVFKRSCQYTLRSDVPVGISLSGGFDSGSILSMVAPVYKGDLKAVSVGYPGYPDNDERRQAEGLAMRFGVPFYSVEVSEDEFLEDFPELVWNSDDPIADIAAYSQYRVWKAAHHLGLKVILGGLGGDELFWGYPWTARAAHLSVKKDELIGKYSWLVKMLQPLLGHWSGRRMFDDKLPLLSTLLGRDEQLVFYDQIIPFRQAEEVIVPLYTSEFTQLALLSETYSILDSKRPWKNIDRLLLKLIADVWLVSNCIVLGDRLSMATSVELRSPFLNHKLIETVWGLDALANSWEKPPKYWFKKAMEGTVPISLFDRPKRGFTPPVSGWTRKIIRKYGKLLRGGFLVDQGVVSEEKIKNFLSIGALIPTNWYPLYELILLEVWGREYVWGQSWQEVKKTRN